MMGRGGGFRESSVAFRARVSCLASLRGSAADHTREDESSRDDGLTLHFKGKLPLAVHISFLDVLRAGQLHT
jgi:hypothetical protein